MKKIKFYSHFFVTEIFIQAKIGLGITFLRKGDK